MVNQMLGSRKGLMAASMLMGIVYTVMGLLELAANDLIAIEVPSYLSNEGDVILVLVFLSIGAIFLIGAQRLRSGAEGEAHIIVGCMLALLVGLVVLMTMIAGGADAYLVGEAFDWSPMNAFTPAIPMIIPSLAVLIYALRSFNIDTVEAST